MIATIPAGFHSVTPMLVLKDAPLAIEFYQRAFGAVERFSMPGPDGRGVMHAELRIGDSIVMLGEEQPGAPCRSAESMGGSPVSFYIYCEDAEQACRRALDACAESQMAVADMFWGDRVGTVRDPFGYSWSLASHTRDLTMEEIRQGAQAAFAAMAGREGENR